MKLHSALLKLLCVLFFSVTLGFLFLTFDSQDYLVIENKTNNEVYNFYLNDENFSLGYTHSVMKTPCEEFFEVKDHEIMHLTKTIYESYGVGLPFLSDTNDEGTYKLEDNKFVLHMNREFKTLTMYISPIPNHYVKIGENKIYLNKLLPETNTKIKLYIKKKFW